jgi:hypothetical protein
MLPNYAYDLIHAIKSKSDAIAVYDTYMKDSPKGCTECTNLWKELKRRDEEDLSRLTSELQKHFQSGQFSTGTTSTHTSGGSTPHTSMR